MGKCFRMPRLDISQRITVIYINRPGHCDKVINIKNV